MRPALVTPSARLVALVVVAEAVEPTEEQRLRVEQGDELGERHVMPHRPVDAIGLRKSRMGQAKIEAVHAEATSIRAWTFLTGAQVED